MTAPMFDVMARGAELSACGTYRYTLTRTWDPADRPVAWIMLNPSTADAAKDDPTIRRCISFARGWGFGGIVVVNLFAARATDPGELCSFIDPVGPDNDLALFDTIQGLTTVCAWGASVPDYWRQRPPAVLRRLREGGAEVGHVGLTKHGHPRHPLYVRGDTALMRWSA